MEAEHNARWAQMAYLDGPGYTIMDRIEAKLDLRRQYFSGSSSHGVQNSIKKIPTQPCSPPFVSSLPESKEKHNFRTVDYAREIRESCARILELLQEASPVHELNLTTSTENSTTDFNGGMVVLPEETTQKLIDMPESCVGSKPDVKTTLADSFLSEHLVVDSVVEGDCCRTKVTPLDMDRKKNNSPVVINQGVFKAPIHLSIPPDLVHVPPPPLAPPWLRHSVYPVPLDSPPLTIESNTSDSFQLDQAVLTRTLSQFDNPNALQVINMLRKNPAIDANVIPHEFLLPFVVRPIVSSLITDGEFCDFRTSTSHTYQLFVERPLKITFTWNIVHLQCMNINLVRLQISVSQQIKLSLDNVLLACATFESLLLGTQGLVYVIQICGVISLKCKKFAFGSAFEISVFAPCLAKLVGNGDFRLYSCLVVNPFGYIGSQCGCIISLDCYGVVLVEVLIGKQLTKRIMRLIISCCKPIMQYRHMSLSKEMVCESLTELAFTGFEYAVHHTNLVTCVSYIGLAYGNCWRPIQLEIVVDVVMVLESLLINRVHLAAIVELLLYMKYIQVFFKNLPLFNDYTSQSIASFICNGCTLALVGLENILQQLQKLSYKSYPIQFLSYMNDLSHDGAMEVVGLISFSYIICVAVTEGLLLSMTLSLAIGKRSSNFGIHYMAFNPSDNHGNITCKIPYVFVDERTTSRNIHFVIVLFSVLDVVTLLSGCFVHKGSSQFNQWDPGGCSFVYWEGLLEWETSWTHVTWKVATTPQHYIGFNLEDKVDFKGDGNVMSQRAEKGNMRIRNMDPYK